MGLTGASTGAAAVDRGLDIQKLRPDDRVIALAGNPNVGKSTVFNSLTGMHQHTGNWPGKTVGSAQGRCEHRGRGYVLVDLPGTYSLMAHSAEEEVARDFLCFGGADGAVVVCDATCLERNLNLVLQTLELEPRTVVCVNLMDEAAKKGIRVDLEELSKRLGVPVVGACAGRGQGLEELLDEAEKIVAAEQPPQPIQVQYPGPIETAVEKLLPLVEARTAGKLPGRWTALRLLEGEPGLLARLEEALGVRLAEDGELAAALAEARTWLEERGISRENLGDRLAAGLVMTAEAVCAGAVKCTREDYNRRDRRLDRLFTSRATGIPVMLALLAGVFWLTIQGANYPSQLLSDGLFWLQDRLTDLFTYWNAPEWLHGALVLGVYRVLAWVVSVMLPPMAIFFPLFTLLEDFGYLPRVAFVLDHAFQKARACGKQALTMAMGFGCNAAGVVGCRIIDSPRERLIARTGAGAVVRPAANRGDRAGGAAHLPGLPAAVGHGAQGGALLLHPGAAALPPPQGGAGDCPLGIGPDAVRAGPGGDDCRSRWAAHLGTGQRTGGGCQPAGPLHRLSGPAGPGTGHGRRDSDRLSPGVSRQRDCHPHYAHGLSGHRQPDRL